MDANLEYFEKFIVKQIVRGVKYNPKSDEFEFYKVQVTNDIIQTIINEGQHYGLSEGACRDMLTRTSNNIRVTPSVDIQRGSVEVKNISLGQHFRINFVHPEKGPLSLDLLMMDATNMLVLGSTIRGLDCGEVLKPMDKVWNNGFYVDFVPERNEELQQNTHTHLHLGKLLEVQFFYPSVVHQILDSTCQYTYKELSLLSPKKKNVLESFAGKTQRYLFWIPNKWNPISFIWEAGREPEGQCPFVINDVDGVELATISIDKDFDLSKVDYIDRFVEVLFDCCKWKNAFNGVEDLNYIKTTKVGKVKKVRSESGVKEWELIDQPQIKFMYG